MLQFIPVEERPRERCLKTGPQSLSLRECLAIILGRLTPAQEILDRVGRGLPPFEQEVAFFTALEKGEISLLRELRGLGPAQLARLQGVLELARRYHYFRSPRSARSPSFMRDFAQLALRQIPAFFRNHTQEWIGFVAELPNLQLSELCIVELGARTHVNFEPSEFFARLLALRPRNFVVIHNHPSGDTTPSSQDFDLTRRLHGVSRALGVPFGGHWIVSHRDEYWISPQAVIHPLRNDKHPMPTLC